MVDLLKDYGFYKYCEHNKTDNTIIYKPTGSYMLFTSLDDAEKIKLKLSDIRQHRTAVTQDSPKKEAMFDVSEFGLETDSLPKKFLEEIAPSLTMPKSHVERTRDWF